MPLNSFRSQLYKKIINNKKYVYYPLAIYWIFLIAATSFPSEALPSFGVNDKIEHLSAYFVLAVFFSLTLFIQTKNLLLKKYWNQYSVIILLIYGIFDEVHQYFIPGRFFDWLDLLANFSGIVLGVYLIRKYFVIPLQKEINFL